MRAISCISCFIFILLFSGVATADIATVHGVAYEWSTFEPLDNAIVAVNSTPAQSMVAKYGVYSFELANGTYQITASYYEGDQLTFFAEDTIIVSDEGSYVLDLLLLPSYSSSEEQNTGSMGTESGSTQGNSLLIGAGIVVVILLALLVSQLKRKPQTSVPVTKPKAPEVKAVAAEQEEKSPVITQEPLPEEVPVEESDITAAEIINEPVSVPEAETKKEPEPIASDAPVPADLQEILDILKSHDGRMTQKDMRKRLKYSEGKVSLMLLDLEKRGKIQKFKKGRGNVLFLVQSDE